MEGTAPRHRAGPSAPAVVSSYAEVLYRWHLARGEPPERAKQLAVAGARAAEQAPPAKPPRGRKGR